MQTKGFAHTRLRHLTLAFLVGLALSVPQFVLAAARSAVHKTRYRKRSSH